MRGDTSPSAISAVPAAYPRKPEQRPGRSAPEPAVPGGLQLQELDVLHDPGFFIHRPLKYGAAVDVLASAALRFAFQIPQDTREVGEFGADLIEEFLLGQWIYAGLTGNG